MPSSSYVCLHKDTSLFLGILATDAPQPRNSALHHLTKQLLQKYRKEVRPVHDWTEATTVYLDVFVRAVLDVVRTILPLPVPATFPKTTCCLRRRSSILESLVELVGELC